MSNLSAEQPFSPSGANRAGPNLEAPNLASRWAALRQVKPQQRNRDAADELGVSEAELIASRSDAANFRLLPDWPALFAHLPKLGRVMALTRNENAVHERHGVYEPASFNGMVGVVLGPDIDLRIFLKSWTFGFAVEEPSRRGLLRSLLDLDPLLPDLAEAIAATRRDAPAGEHQTPRAYLERLLQAAGRSVAPAAAAPAPASIEELTERELKILRLLKAGLGNRELAQSLFLSEATVKWHLHNIYEKLKVRNRTQAIRRARELSLL